MPAGLRTGRCEKSTKGGGPASLLEVLTTPGLYQIHEENSSCVGGKCTYRSAAGISDGTGVVAPGGGTHFLYSADSVAESVPEREREKFVASAKGGDISGGEKIPVVDEDSAAVRAWPESIDELSDGDGSGAIGAMVPPRRGETRPFIPGLESMDCSACVEEPGTSSVVSELPWTTSPGNSLLQACNPPTNTIGIFRSIFLKDLSYIARMRDARAAESLVEPDDSS